jgi:hypothetical protein
MTTYFGERIRKIKIQQNLYQWQMASPLDIDIALLSTIKMEEKCSPKGRSFLCYNTEYEY